MSSVSVGMTIKSDDFMDFDKVTFEGKRVIVKGDEVTVTTFDYTVINDLFIVELKCAEGDHQVIMTEQEFDQFIKIFKENN